ncbi:hypothetical protein TrLO_g14382 [Triparma laevis f. longispina]|uniref:Uncharacterized protein n=1 Tax=Triparma laevis f. longispina TaxID=1714387 RepID=A0A9W7FVJ5_9STRA|nr:hypothetical protein TrLO_g14382 [Triparma laevis f. longispina]
MVAVAPSDRRLSEILGLAHFDSTMSTNFKSRMFQYLAHTGLLSLLASLLPVVCILFNSIFTTQNSRTYYGEQYFIEPALFSEDSGFPNVTVTPITPSKYKDYFMETRGGRGWNNADMELVIIPFQLSIWGPMFFTSVLLFREKTNRRKLFLLILTFIFGYVGGALLHEYLYQDVTNGFRTDEATKIQNLQNIVLLFFPPILPAIFSNAKRCKMYLFFFGVWLTNFVVSMFYIFVAIPKFLDPETSSTEHAATFPFLARLMQSSATTVGESLLFELAGTIAEFVAAHTLLKGKTPVQTKIENASKVRKRVKSGMKEKMGTFSKGGSKGKIEVGDDVESNDEGYENENENENRNKAVEEEANLLYRRKYCSSVMIMIGISEAASIVTSSSFWLITNINPGAPPGSSRLPQSQIVINLFIMLFGEVVLTDFLVAWASVKFTYKVDILKEWQNMKKAGTVFIAAFVCVLSMQPLFVLINITSVLCYTSLTDDLDAWTVTKCSKDPIATDVLRGGVGEEHLEVWEAGNGL